MAQNAWEKIQALTAQLNRYRDEYYNSNAPSASDEVYDRMYDELAALEMETGIWMTDSPTRTVGFQAVSDLKKTDHPIPLLSLNKTKSVEELVSFAGEHQILLMLKLDGLTVKLTYEDGKLIEASTRGDGDTGEVITHNVCGISGIPQHIPYKERLVVSGEAFIRPNDFLKLQETLTDSNGERYKNGRNLAAGSVRLLDAAVCRERKVMFMPFAVVEGFPELETKSQKLRKLPELGFHVCKFVISKRKLTCQEMADGIAKLRQFAEASDIPIDGIVASYNDIAFSRSCGRTGHHYKDGMAFKFEDELHETKLLSIEWNPSRSGEISPVAVFEPVVIDGCEVSRASLHNLSFIEGMELMPGCRILVSKRNMIIPHVEENLDRGRFVMGQAVPERCPCCGEPARIHESRSVENGKDKITKTLFCDNQNCETRRLRQFVHFVSQKAMNIEGLSEATLEKFIGKGWIHTYMDIYGLDRHRNEIVNMEGFGEKSWQRLWDAIQGSRNTTFERYLIAMDIPMVGNTASRTLAGVFHSDLEEFEDAVHHQYDFTQLPDFGDTLHNNIHEWFYDEENLYVWEVLQQMLHIEKRTAENNTAAVRENPFVGMNVVVTGKVEPYTRSGINEKIESLGAHAGSSVSKKTDYLVCGENAGSKLAKARELGITVLTPAQFFQMAGE
ncbi:NAD-dependent DNA ligase LigA [Otoolea muris]|uniref:NAD-dependent DNA ligase LigA n=1 Tax=Otoolea muris TaxID=2941515 RepID=UPI00203EEEBB|nr:NAD-dependent DNA ligase LigA [Otoolea muris]